uniref:Uncharacterized protein n=1 Tax=Romanomermis culicivorax TaxID=13658 RepID=A0A915I9V8_ROMCU
MNCRHRITASMYPTGSSTLPTFSSTLNSNTAFHSLSYPNSSSTASIIFPLPFPLPLPLFSLDSEDFLARFVVRLPRLVESIEGDLVDETLPIGGMVGEGNAGELATEGAEMGAEATNELGNGGLEIGGGMLMAEPAIWFNM